MPLKRSAPATSGSGLENRLYTFAGAEPQGGPAEEGTPAKAAGITRAGRKTMVPR